MRYDIAIIGKGPAGVEAAVTAAVRKKNIILFDPAKSSRKVAKASYIENYLGLPATTGRKLSNAFDRHLKAMDIQPVKDKIQMVMSMGDYFILQGNGNSMYEASAVILCTGVNMAKPLPGEDENLGRGVSYCATCDAALVRGKATAVIAYTKEAAEDGEFLTDVASSVDYFKVYTGNDKLKSSVNVIEDIPVKLEKREDGMYAVSKNNEYGPYFSIFVMREASFPDKMVPGLLMDGPHAVVNRQMETNIPGFFAAGDITGKPYQYIKSAGEGNVAALAAVSYIDSLKKKEGQN